MEKLIYETKPYAFIILGVITIMSNKPYPALSNFSAILLMACSAFILYWRHVQRSAPRPARHRR